MNLAVWIDCSDFKYLRPPHGFMQLSGLLCNLDLSEGQCKGERWTGGFICGWSAQSTCMCSGGSWRQIAKGKFKFWVMLKSLFINNKVQRLQFCSYEEWAMVAQMWLYENTNTGLLLRLSSLRPSHAMLDFVKKNTRGRSDTRECVSWALTESGSRVKFIGV